MRSIAERRRRVKSAETEKKRKIEEKKQTMEKKTKQAKYSIRSYAHRLRSLLKPGLATTKRALRLLKRMTGQTQIDCPSRLTDAEAVEFLRELFRHKDSDHLIINFNALGFAHPLATLLTAIGIRDLLRQRESASRKTSTIKLNEHNEAISYLKFIGFFRLAGLNEGKAPGAAPGGARYVPITILQKNNLPGQGVLQERIETQSIRLSAVIHQRKGNMLRPDMLSYCIREAIRNAFEHAETDKCFIMAQRWSGGTTEIAIADKGVGLLHTLRQAHNVTNAEQALSLALKPGISQNIEPYNNDPWQNSGFGLYVLSELGARLGNFAIASDNLILLKNEGREVLKPLPIRGTAIKLQINPSKIYFPALLEQIVTQGEKEAQNIPGARHSASKSSKAATPLR